MNEWLEERLQVFAKLLKQINIVLEIGARRLIENNLRRYIHLCKRFNTKLLRFVTNNIGREPSIKEIISIIQNNVFLLQQY